MRYVGWAGEVFGGVLGREKGNGTGKGRRERREREKEEEGEEGRVGWREEGRGEGRGKERGLFVLATFKTAVEKSRVAYTFVPSIGCKTVVSITFSASPSAAS